MILLASIVAASAIGIGLAVYAYLVEPYIIRTTRLDIAWPDLPDALDGLTICHLSDLHAVNAGRLEHRLAGILSRLQVDLCAVTGDMISSKSGLSAFPLVFGAIKPRLGTFAVPGNGEYKTSTPISDVSAALSDLGVRMLLNESETLSLGGMRLHIIGVDDPHRRRDDLAKAESGVSGEGFRLLLAHSPDALVRLREDSADLVLAGHTHGGQVRIPFVGALWLHCHYHLGLAMGHFGPPALSRALGRSLPRTHLYISRGLGGSGIRARFMCTPEVVIVTLRRASE